MSIAIINTQLPNASPDGWEALDMAFSFANLELNVALFFIGDGVFQLLKDQQPEQHGYKNHTKSYAALDFYDIDHIYVCEASLKENNLKPEDLVISPMLFNRTDMSSLISQFDKVINF